MSGRALAVMPSCRVALQDAPRFSWQPSGLRLFTPPHPERRPGRPPYTRRVGTFGLEPTSNGVMPLASLPPMTRKVLALVVVLIVSGLAPATAVIGFCAKMPCCFSEVQDGPVLNAEMADCCTTISCYEAPSNELTFSAKMKNTGPHAPAMLPVVAAIVNEHIVRSTFDDPSPPRTAKQRLSSLSILLI